MKGLIAAVFGLVGLSLTGLVAWLMWGPLLHFLWSIIPPTAQYAWVGKLACTVMVGWFGGIGLPIVGLATTVLVTLKILAD